MKLLTDLITAFDPKTPNFRPTELYNESWLVKLIMGQATRINNSEFPIGFLPKSTWFSEGLLPSAFQPRFRGDPLGEARTNADVVVGHIEVGKRRKVDLELAHDATQFTVVEAKIRSPFSPGTTNARYFDQAARSVACMAEVIARSTVKASDLKKLDFVVLAPQDSIKQGKFTAEMSHSSIKSKVQRRVSEYGGDRDHWYQEQFLPLVKNIRLYSLSWEEAIDWIGRSFPDVLEELNEFYNWCLEFA